MSHPNRLKVFYNNTQSKYDNLNLDIIINKWAEENGDIKILSNSISTGRLYYFPGRKVTHFDIFASVLFELPSNYSNPSNVTDISLSDSDGKKIKVNWLEPTVDLSIHQKPIEYYLVYLKEDTPTSEYVLIDKTEKTNIFLSELKKGKSYVVKIVSLDQLVGESTGIEYTFIMS